MSDEPGADPPATPAHARLQELLAPLRDQAPESPPQLTHVVVRAARWQRPARAALRTVGLLAAAASDAIALVLGQPRRQGR